MAKVRCPNRKCKSVNCTPLAQKGKYSVGKGAAGAVVGVIIGGPLALVGAAAGLNGKKKVTMMCNDCGEVFEIKL